MSVVTGHRTTARPRRVSYSGYPEKMPAGELFALVAIVTAVVHHVGGVSHVIALTDSSATAEAVNGGASGSAQMQALLLWLSELCPGVRAARCSNPARRLRWREG